MYPTSVQQNPFSEAIEPNLLDESGTKPFMRRIDAEAILQRNGVRAVPRTENLSHAGSNGMNSSLKRNIEALRQRRRQEMMSAGWEEKLASAITAFTGSMRFVYLHLLIYGLWIIFNLIPGVLHFDPTFVILAMAASVEAIFLSTFVLISQNRAMAETDKRDDLDLHINLLAEHELTKLITMVAAITDKLEVRTGAEKEIDEIAKDVAPEVVLTEIEQNNRK